MTGKLDKWTIDKVGFISFVVPEFAEKKKDLGGEGNEQPRRCFSPPLRSLPPGQVLAARPSRSYTFTNAKRHSRVKGLTKIFLSLFFVTEAYKISPFLKPPSPCYCACGVWAWSKKSSIGLAESKSSWEAHAKNFKCCAGDTVRGATVFLAHRSGLPAGESPRGPTVAAEREVRLEPLYPGRLI